MQTPRSHSDPDEPGGLRCRPALDRTDRPVALRKMAISLGWHVNALLKNHNYGELWTNRAVPGLPGCR